MGADEQPIESNHPAQLSALCPDNSGRTPPRKQGAGL